MAKSKIIFLGVDSAPNIKTAAGRDYAEICKQIASGHMTLVRIKDCFFVFKIYKREFVVCCAEGHGLLESMPILKDFAKHKMLCKSVRIHLLNNNLIRLLNRLNWGFEKVETIYEMEL